ncbi:unnamed protein product [Rotaria magnacalcarata]|uniref:Uncharacterized protein n=2 Tax=Rotaria magnacalcarata TaxID=392030 RepID=A0A819PEJ1_9BILA|nr:unnamed protein product [Rotaria magnacalcarata]CAF2005185.1 unnamed protein product [Rotaria magnacalcarata]CAF4013085.1 unnamed protein product [Rotaria magnacalcarata]CAF4271986.1 unnamed protein product [Rotaria magnacalcarata]
MQSLLHLVFLLTLNYLTNAVVLKTPMNNNYPQIAVLGCDSRKANLYYDIDRQVWVEHLISSCVNNEQSILEFCQQAYPSLHIGNIVRLDTVLTFENWCELISPIDKNGDNIHRCKQGSGSEEIVQSFRCLYKTSKREDVTLPTTDCSIHSIIGTGECFRAEKWQQLASMECANKSMNLNSSVMTLDWCGLSEFRGIEFVCCPTSKIDDSDYETSPDEQDSNNNWVEDNPIREPILSSHRKIIAMTLASREPSWIEDYRRWNTDPAYFADDEEANDYQPSPIPKSEENKRFSKEKETFRQKYKEQIGQLKSRWQIRQNEIQSLANRDAAAAQQQYETNEIEFRQEYDVLKQSANRERIRMNELHEIHLDVGLNELKTEANKKLLDAWNEKPLKTENVEKALYNYLQILLRDRIHLVNRYERLRAVDPEQAERKRMSIHERLRLIVDRTNDAVNQLRLYPNLQSKIQPRLDTLFFEYDEVNQAAEKLLSDYSATPKTTLLPTTTKTAGTTKKTRPLPLGRDENKIYPFSASPITNSYDNNDEYDYATNDEYDEDDDGADKKSSTTSTTTTTGLDIANYDQIEAGDSDWDINNDDTESVFDIKIDDQNQQAFINENDIRSFPSTKRIQRNLLITYLPYVFGCLLILCIIIGIFIFRFIRQNRLYGNRYEKKYVFTEVDSYTPEEKALHALQMNGYENPTYKFFESQTPKC